MVEAVALGDGTRELLLIEYPGFKDVALEGLLRLLGRLDGGVHRLAVGEAELDDDVVEKYAAAVGIGGRGDPGGPDLETGDALASRAGEELGHSGATCEARSESARSLLSKAESLGRRRGERQRLDPAGDLERRPGPVADPFQRREVAGDEAGGVIDLAVDEDRAQGHLPDSPGFVGAANRSGEDICRKLQRQSVAGYRRLVEAGGAGHATDDEDGLDGFLLDGFPLGVQQVHEPAPVGEAGVVIGAGTGVDLASQAPQFRAQLDAFPFVAEQTGGDPQLGGVLGQVRVRLGGDRAEDPRDAAVRHLQGCGDPIGGSDGPHRVGADAGLGRNQSRASMQSADPATPDLDHVVDLLVAVEPPRTRTPGTTLGESAEQGVGRFGEVLEASLGQPDQRRRSLARPCDLISVEAPSRLRGD